MFSVKSLFLTVPVRFSLVDHKLTFSNLFSELPIRITSSSLVTAFLSTLALPASSSSSLLTSSALLPSNLAPLSLQLPSALTSSLEQTSKALDDYRREHDSLSYNARDIGRQKAKLDQLLASGVAEDEARRIVRVPNEQSRLASLLLLAQVDEAAKGMAGAAGGGMARMFASTV